MRPRISIARYANQHDLPMPKIPSYLLNLAGEYRICSELNKRGVFATDVVQHENAWGKIVDALGGPASANPSTHGTKQRR